MQARILAVALCIGSVLECALAMSAAHAQAFPSRPITMIVPFAAGGPSDVVGRLVAERMQGSLHQSVIVENVAGAGGTIGVGRVARANADGYTLALGIWSTHVANRAIYTLPYDLIFDFEPVALISREVSLVIVAKKTLPAKNLSELIAGVKANPDRVSFGTAGVGSPPHIAGVLFQNLIGSRFQFVHYRGAAPAMQDLLAGQFDLMIDSPATSLPQARAGAVKAYAVTATTRLPSAPEIPTVDEAGLPGMYLSVWFALWAPKGTPTAVIDTLNSAVRSAVANPAMRSRLAEIGQETFPADQQTPAALRDLQRADIERWWPIIKSAGIKAQ